MKRFVLTAIVLIAAVLSASAQRDSLLVMFWNLENFFDWKDGGQNASDTEFSTAGARHWSSRRFYAKADAIGKTVLWTADRFSRLPDVVAVAEVENSYVLKQLIYSSPLRKFGYSFIHYDSPDPRGIDVALLYRKDRLSPVCSRPVHISGFATRDILEATFATFSEDTVTVLVNHHPSKYGGAGTGSRRTVAMETLCGVCDSLADVHGALVNTIAVGDFNDTPDAEAFSLLHGRLVNLAIPLHAAGRGSIRYDGKWELIDMVMVSDDLSEDVMEILEPPFLLTRDASHSGLKPLRTYVGPRYNGGVSDHLPVAAMVHLK